MKNIIVLSFLCFMSPSVLAGNLGSNIGTCRGFISYLGYSSSQEYKMISQIALKEWEAFFYLNANNFSYKQSLESMENYLKAGLAVQESMRLYHQMHPEREKILYPPNGKIF